MNARQSRYALFLIVITLLVGLIPSTVSAQTEDDQPNYLDAMDGATPALLSEESPDPTRFDYRYAIGEYILQALDSTHAGDLFSYIDAGSFTDSRTAVDVAVDFDINGDQTGKHIFVGCRAGEDHNGYYLQVQPGSGTVSLWRLDSGSPVQLAEENASDVVIPGFELNRIEIECALDSISGIVNGETVVSASDDSYDSGLSYIGAGNDDEFPDTLFAVFDNLEVFDLEDVQLDPTGTAVPDETQATPLAVDPAVLEAGVIEHALAVGPIAGPFVEDIELAHASLQVLSAGVQVSNLHTEVRFVVPIDAPPGVWSIGFCFWVDPLGNCYDVYVQSDGATAEWVYGRSGASGEFELLETGPITGLDLTPGASNFIGLSVVDDTGILIVNSPDPAASFALASPSGTGDVTRWIAFEAADETDTRSFIMSTDEFYVWDLSGMPAVAAQLTEPAEPTADAEPTEPADPTATTEPTEPADPTATTEPTESADPTATGPPSDEIAVAFADLKDQAQLQPALGGPYADEILQSATSLPSAGTLLSLADLYTTVTFLNPADTAQPWDVGVAFRSTGDDTEPRFILQSSGDWFVTFGDTEPALSGQVSQIDDSPRGANTIEIAAQGNTAYVAVNGIVVTQLDLSQVNRRGDVYLSTGFFAANVVDGRPVGYQDFQVWGFPAPTSTDTTTPFDITPGEQLAGHDAGLLTETDATIEISAAAVDVADFYTSVVFVVPEDDSAPWDFTFGFRDTGGNDQYRLTIVSDGAWTFALRNDPPLASGTLENLLIIPGEENTIDVFAQGAGGAAALNGVEFTTMDLSELSDPGDIWIATGTNAENTVEGRTTQYSDFVVWSLA